MSTIQQHIENTSNPHSDSKAALGLGNILNQPIATEIEARGRSLTNRYMDHNRVAQALNERLGTLGLLDGNGQPIFTQPGPSGIRDISPTKLVYSGFDGIIENSTNAIDGNDTTFTRLKRSAGLTTVRYSVDCFDLVDLIGITGIEVIVKRRFINPEDRRWTNYRIGLTASPHGGSTGSTKVINSNFVADPSLRTDTYGNSGDTWEFPSSWLSNPTAIRIDLRASYGYHQEDTHGFDIYWISLKVHHQGGTITVPLISMGDKGPGATTLINGDNNAGYYGEVPASELINGTNLTSFLGLTAGTATAFQNEPWLKFSYFGTILYVAKKPFRTGLTAANLRTLRSQDRFIVIDGRQYRIRLMRGGESRSEPNYRGKRFNWSGQNWTGDSFTLPALTAHAHENEFDKLFAPLVNVLGSNQSTPNWSVFNETEVGLNLGPVACDENSWLHVSSGGSNLTSGNTVLLRTLFGFDMLGILGATEDTAPWRPVLELVQRDPSRPITSGEMTPGPKYLVGGDLQAGYYGEVGTSDFISGSALASTIGLSQGSSINSTTNWLKFSFKEKAFYIPKLPIRHSLAWYDIYLRGATGIQEPHPASVGVWPGGSEVTQNRVVIIAGQAFRVRLLSIYPDNRPNSSPGNFTVDSSAYAESELLKLVAKVSSPLYDFQLGPNWVNFTPLIDLGMNSQNTGGQTIVMQYSSAVNFPGGVAGDFIYASSTTEKLSKTEGYKGDVSTGARPSTYGWRPVLEHLGPA